ERLANQTDTTTDQPDANYADQQQIGTDHHNADDKYRVLVDHAKRHDHASDHHQHAKAREQTNVNAHLAKNLHPNESLSVATQHPTIARRDHVDARQHEVLVGDVEAVELSEDLVGNDRTHVRPQHRYL